MINIKNVQKKCITAHHTCVASSTLLYVNTYEVYVKVFTYIYDGELLGGGYGGVVAVYKVVSARYCGAAEECKSSSLP